MEPCVQVRRGVYPLREAWRALYAMVQANMLRVAAETQTFLPVCCDAYRPGGGSVWPKQLDDRPNSARNLVTGARSLAFRSCPPKILRGRLLAI